MLENAWDMIGSAWDQLQLLMGLELDVQDVGVGQMTLRAVLIYALALLLVRIASKRFLSQATAFDVIVAIMLGSIMSRAINGSAPFLPTILGSAAIVVLHWVFAFLAFHTSFFGTIVKGTPRLLIKEGRVLEDELRSAKISSQDLEQALRLHGPHADPSMIRRAYLERNGSISVSPYETEPHVLDVSVEDGVQVIRLKVE